MINYSAISYLTIVFAVFSFLFSFLLSTRIYTQKHKRPWIFISISCFFIVVKTIFMITDVVIYSQDLTYFIILFLEFTSVVLVLFSVLLEYMIVKFYKGKFVEFKVNPIEEGSLSGQLDLDVRTGRAYFAYKGNKKKLLKEFAKATRIGFNGLLITQFPPLRVREEFFLERTPIVWVIDNSVTNSKFIKENTTDNSDVLAPTNIDSIINDFDNFTQSTTRKPFILIEIDDVLAQNSNSIVFEMLSYMKNKISLKGGVLIAHIDRELEAYELEEIKSFMSKLE